MVKFVEEVIRRNLNTTVFISRAELEWQEETWGADNNYHRLLIGNFGIFVNFRL